MNVYDIDSLIKMRLIHYIRFDTDIHYINSTHT